MVYITGDTHGEFRHIKRFCEIANTSKSDTLIILGDSGLNYYTDERQHRFKSKAARLPITLFCIHGNHEERAELLPQYTLKRLWGGRVLVEPQYPSLLFAQDGEVYNIPSQSGIKPSLVIGGAYSVDKFYRLNTGANWYQSEQPSDSIKLKVESALKARGLQIDTILSHTCPFRYIPREWFIAGIDQSTVDVSTELWLDDILTNLIHYNKWYCGHYHGDKVIDKLEFMYYNIHEF